MEKFKSDVDGQSSHDRQKQNMNIYPKRQTDKQTNKKTIKIQIDKQTALQRSKHMHPNRQTYAETPKHTSKHQNTPNRQIDTKIDKNTPNVF